jgi:hypothetical protein
MGFFRGWKLESILSVLAFFGAPEVFSVRAKSGWFERRAKCAPI